jgi:hypothetical protein
MTARETRLLRGRPANRTATAADPSPLPQLYAPGRVMQSLVQGRNAPLPA